MSEALQQLRAPWMRRTVRIGGGMVVWCAILMAAPCAVTAEPAADAANDELVQMVVNLLGDADADLRAVGLEQVRSEVKGTAATQAFVKLLPELTAEGQAGLIAALADRSDRSARPGILTILRDSKDPTVRVAAILAVGSLGEVDDVDRLVAILAEGTPAEQAAAKKSVTRLLGDGVAARIASHIGKGDSKVSVELIQILATRRALDTVGALLDAARGTDPAIRGAAMQALSELADTTSLPGMLAAVLKAEPGRERDAAERCTAKICEKVKDPNQRAETLLAEVHKHSAADQLALMPLLGRVGGDPALKVIEAAIADSDPKQHEMGIRALCLSPSAAVAPRLIELVRTDAHPHHQAMALAAVVRVAPYPDGRTDQQRLALLEQALAMSQTDDQRDAVVKRAGTIRCIESLRFLMPYTDQPRFAETACLSIVELAHHRGLRVPNKSEFSKALDKVIATSKDAVVIDRAKRYKAGQTWVRPK